MGVDISTHLRLWGTAIAALLLGAGPAGASVTPTFYTTASPQTSVGFQVFDHANLPASATGSITFKLYAPGDTTCQTPVFASTVPVSGTGSDDSQRYTTPSAGTYRWIAAYSGDANNSPVANVCGSASQSVIVNKVFPVVTVNAAAGTAGRIHAVAALSGGFAPATGTITFTVTGPNDQFCGGAAVYTATVPVGGAGSYDS
ncbi:MAG: hypothetical protein QOE44_737, partial [Solirubrobacteraceae bacterium]|nr:hypothetical protein [Solirubrobacteraceae bacterium]